MDAMVHCTHAINLSPLCTPQAERVARDRLIAEKDIEDFDAVLREIVKKTIEKDARVSSEETFQEPRIFSTGVTSTDGSYLATPSMERLRQVMEDKLVEYNESNAVMDLVLFDQALEHICRIARILSNPGGNAMLIGVGGSGKQSLSRLAAFIVGMEVRQMAITGSFKIEDLIENLREMFKLAIVKNQPVAWLLTDSQIVNDKFLIYINGILSTGWVPDLFPRDEVDGIVASIRNEAKAAGVPDTPVSVVSPEERLW